jgi:uncharacterized repeat protein (TIGR01451 family)
LDGNKTVTATFVFVNSPPVAIAQTITTTENTPKTVTLTGNDADGDSLTFTLVDLPTHGALSGTLPLLTYTPNGYYSGSDSFTFTVNDGTVDSSTATVQITVVANEYALTIASEHGQVRQSPAQASYKYGEVVQLTAEPAAGWLFTHWSGAISGQSNPINLTMQGNAAVTANYIQAQANLSITHGIIPTVLNPSATWTIPLTVSNAGPLAADSVVVTDSLPSGVTFVSASGTGWTCGVAVEVVTCTKPSLAVGASAEITVVVKVPGSATKLTNTVQITSAQVDLETTNNTSIGETIVAGIAVTGPIIYIPIVSNAP